MKIISGKTIVITGGTKGIGKALSELYKKWNNTVIVIARGAEDNGTDSFKCDLTHREQIYSTFDKIFKEYGQIDLLVNNVGMGQTGAIEFINDDMIEEIVKLNLMSTIYCTKAVLKNTPSDYPLKIVNIASAAAFAVCPFRTMYSVTKDAINMFTVGMRVELYGSKVQMCSISLGDTQTDFGKHHYSIFTTSERYGTRIMDCEGYSVSRSQSGACRKLHKVKKDKRMPVKQAVLAIAEISAKKKFKYYTYCVGAKYKTYHIIAKILSVQQLSNIVRKVFEH